MVALSGGIGGAKLALGLYRALAPDRLAVVANPGDDFEHLGLTVCPDADTVMYTLAGVVNPGTGWGLAGETWSFMAALERLGGETWFRLGDGDLATHVERSRRLAAGETATAVMDLLRRRLGVRARILPPSDAPVRTVVESDAGDLMFQHYFVRDRCEPVVRGFRFAGAQAASASAAVLAALADADLRAVVVCPSNPFISIDPILAVAGVRDALVACRAPVVAVSPVVGGAAIKGPTAKMMTELGLPVSAATVAAHYRDFLDGYVVDRADAEVLEGLAPLPGLSTGTVMASDDDKLALARAVLDFADRIREGGP